MDGEIQPEGHGGRRPGSGRKRKADKHLAASLRVEERINGWVDGLLDNLKTLADGGDRAANEYLINRLLGKPKEKQEVSGPDGDAVPHKVVVYIPDNQRGDSPPAGTPE